MTLIIKLTRSRPRSMEHRRWPCPILLLQGPLHVGSVRLVVVGREVPSWTRGFPRGTRRPVIRRHGLLTARPRWARTLVAVACTSTLPVIGRWNRKITVGNASYKNESLSYSFSIFLQVYFEQDWSVSMLCGRKGHFFVTHMLRFQFLEKAECMQ